MSLWLARSVLYMLTITKKNRMIVEHTYVFFVFYMKMLNVKKVGNIGSNGKEKNLNNQKSKNR